MRYETQPLETLLASLETGKRPRGGSVELGVPSLGGEHINADCSLKLSSMKYVPEDFFAGLTKGFIHTNDILIVKDGATTGRVGFVDKSFPFKRSAVNEHVFIVRADTNKADPLYLYYFLRSKIGNEQVMSDFRGAAQGGISRGFASKVHIPVRSLSEQRRIVDVLSSADSIVRLRREAEKKTAELIPALFLDMFGDPATNPKGWPIQSLGELISDGPQNGLYKHASLYGEGTPILRIDGFYDGLVVSHKALKRVRIEPEEKKKFRIYERDIVINRVNSVEYLGKSAIIPFLDEVTVFESNMMRFSVSDEEILPEYLIKLLQTTYAKAHVLSKAKHAINQSSINQQDVKSFLVPVPPIKHQTEFAERAEQVRSIQSQQAAATTTAQATFDALLAQVFNA